MSNFTLSTKIILRNDTKANWDLANPVLTKGEMGIEIDTGKLKIGDGVKTWSELMYANVLPNELEGLGYGDMLKAVYDKNGDGKVDSAELADEATVAGKLKTPVNIAGVAFDGSASIDLTKANVGLANVDNTSDLDKPISTATQGALDAILTTISENEAKLGTSATKNVGTAVGNVVEVQADGKIASSIIPSIAITDTFVVASEEAMLALSKAEKGDVAIRTDVKKSYILAEDGYNVLENWKLLESTTSEVLSVNGQTGAVNLTSSDIAEGSNLYYTEERVNANFRTQSSTNLVDGATLLHSTDILILNGGNA